MSGPADVVIVGASAAGLTAAETLRRRGYGGRLTLIGDEPHPPYDRPPLSKQVLAGAWEPDRVALRTHEELALLDAQLRFGRAAAGLDLSARQVVLDGGERIAYDGLILATGVAPRRLPGADLAGVHVLRTLDDALALRQALLAGPRVVVVGAGFLGAEVAATARSLGLDVTLAEPQPVPVYRPFGEGIGGLVARLHLEHGAHLRCGTPVRRLLSASGRVVGVELAEETVLPADVVVLAVGSTPATGWLEGSGLPLNGGIECDERCRAAPGVYAAGDVASWYNPLFGTRMRVEHRMNATEQAMAAAGNLLGDSAPFAPVPYFWSDQYDTRIQAYGIFPADAEVRILHGDPADGHFVAAYGRRATVVGVVGWNAPRETRTLRRLVAERAAWPPTAPRPAQSAARAVPRASPLSDVLLQTRSQCVSSSPGGTTGQSPQAAERTTSQVERTRKRGRAAWLGADHPRYKWVALSNTTLGTLIATINSSIVLISLPAIFNGIHLDPLRPGNVSYLLWMLMGYILVTAVLVVALGRMGDMWGRVRIYNAGFLIFTVTSVILSVDPFHGGPGALWLIGWRIVQAIGGSMLLANSAAIITDAFPVGQRGMALGVNGVAGIAGSFIGLLLGGVLATWDWRVIFWANVPIGLLGTLWAYHSLHETGIRRPARMDWPGNLTFAVGLTALLAAITYGIQPYRGHTMGWTNPWVLAALIGGLAMLAVFCVVETRVAEPMFPLRLFHSAAFAGANAATLLGAIARGGLQFMLIIWLQGIWLPLHGYDYADTPLWAGIYLLPLTVGFLVAGPVSGHLSDKFGARLFAAAGFVVMAVSFAGLLALPTDFSYEAFALLTFLNGLGGGLFAAPNTSIVMSSVPAGDRGAASGMRATFQNAGMVLSLGVFFSLMVAGLAGSLPHTLSSGLTAQGVPAQAAHSFAALPPVGTLFAAFLGFNPMQQLLGPHVLAQLPAADARTLTGREFFPHLISGPFHNGLIVVFALAIAMSLIAAAASLIRGRAAHPGRVPAPARAGEQVSPAGQGAATADCRDR